MMNKQIPLKIIIRTLILLGVSFGIVYFFNQKYYLPAVALIIVLAFLINEIIRFQKKIYREVSNFFESVNYKDFSRRFDEKNASLDIKDLRKGFNSVNNAFIVMSREKEVHYQYLQKMLELVNTGIIAYETEEGEILWINEAFKYLLEIPYLKSIHSLKKRNEILYNEIINLNPGEAKVVNLNPENEGMKLLVSATIFYTDQKPFKLIAFQNISNAIDVNESEAWKKLLSVMTHEIMNSVAPISSLAGTLKKRLDAYVSDQQLDSSATDDLLLGISTIQARSEGLLKFADTYRKLNKITLPDVSTFYVRKLFENIFNLMNPGLEKKSILMDVVLKDPAIRLSADFTLIEQVLINLIINAMDALKETPDGQIILSAWEEKPGKIIISILDNGKGMERDVIEKIFIPFFTTKKTGSGIGLSLCKQIMLAHKGFIRVKSEIGKGTNFTLNF
ncbi:MAG: HAMP domain-containing histidine kinase [Bacteroidetes bacterium]|nr:HAMP domain-containing histidine kinase [Bacteroidota bacterium]